MKKLKKLVALEPVSLIPAAQQEVACLADEAVWYEDIPSSEEELLRRIQDADGVFISYTSNLPGRVMEHCPNLKYVGMCCSLYGEESANVDIRYAREHGITVTGIRDYGDQGVAEYVLWQLVALLHGYGERCFEAVPLELTGLKVGIIGLGASGQVIGRALLAMGAELFYYSRTRKPELEKEGFTYLPLNQLLGQVTVACTCLNKFVTLLYEEQFAAFGNHKILFNTGLSPSFEPEAAARWLEQGDNYLFCDTDIALGSPKLLEYSGVNCIHTSSGRTKQCFDRLSEKVLANLKGYLSGDAVR